MKPIVIFGSSDIARAAYLYITKDMSRDVVAFTVHERYIKENKLMGIDVIPFESITTMYPPEKYDIFIAIGFHGVNHERAKVFESCKSLNYNLVTYINSNVNCEYNVQTGENTVIHEGAWIGPFVTIGNNVVINPGAIISHDVNIGDHCFIGPNATINGRSNIGEYSLISSNAVILQDITVGSKCVIGPGIVISKNIQAETVFLKNNPEPSNISINELIKQQEVAFKKKFTPLMSTENNAIYFPLTSIQEAYWVGRRDNIKMGGISTHLYQEIISEKLDLARFETAWNQLIERHDILRTIISSDATQKVLKEVPYYHIKTLDLANVTETVKKQKVKMFRSEMSHQVLDSEQWPIFDIRCIKLDEKQTNVFLSFDLLIMDGKSIDLLSNEWFALYNNPNIILPEINSSFYEYVKEYTESKKSTQYAKDLEYWKQKIPYFSPASHLPTAQDVKLQKSHKFIRYETQLDSKRWKHLQQILSKYQLDSTSFIVAVYTEIINMWSDSKAMTLNLSTVDRIAKGKKYKNTMGQFASTLLLDLSIEKENSFKDQVQKIQEKLYTDLKHRSVSGVDVLRELNKVSDTGNVSMPIVFTRHNSFGEVGKGSNHLAWLGKSNYAITQTPQVSMDYQLYEYGNEFTIVWDVADELFPEGMIQDMFDAHIKLLNLLVTDQNIWNKTSGELAQLLLPNKDKILYQSINKTDEVHSGKLLYDDFMRHTQAHPKQLAVICDDRTLSYHELEQESAIVSNWLLEKGVKKNELVAIVMAKNWEQVVAVLGVLRAGASYLPLDPSLPKERLDHLLTEGNIHLSLSIPWWNESIEWPKQIETYIIGGSCTEGSDYFSNKVLNVDINPSDLAYVIYTSGSTGTPKGVMISHENAINTIDDIIKRFSINSDDKLLSLASLSFDLSVFDIFGMLSSGGTIVMSTLHKIKDPSHWLEVVKDHHITIWNSVPALMLLLCEYTNHQNLTLDPLRLILLSGDWIPLNLPRQIKECSDHAEIISLGGATEASIWSIMYKIEHIDPSWTSIPYGTPLRNQHIYIYNTDLELCPIWVPGEIYIGGKGVGLGYWKNEALSKESFITHPKTGEHLYKTGDIGRLHPGGFIEFLGRKDTQLKIRGFRVEAGEIEITLEKHPGVSKAIVLPAESGKEKNHLMAYVLREQTQRLTSEELHQLCKDKLPDYMQPSRFIVLDAFPLTSNGKINRQALLLHIDTEERTQPGNKDNGEFNSDTLYRVKRCVSEILHIDDFQDRDNFFNLGATSIDVIRLINRLDQEFGLRLAADHIYNASNFIDLSTIIDKKTNNTILSVSSSAHLTVDSPSKIYDVILDPLDREKFKKGKHNLRTNLDETKSITLPHAESNLMLEKLWASRKSHRHFSEEYVPLKSISKLFNCLKVKVYNDKDRYAYGSAGGLYPLQVYIYAKPNRMNDLEAGIYYYQPIEHCFIEVSSEARIKGEIYDTLINRPIFDEAAFVVFLIADLSAIEPMYGERSTHYATIEAGLMTQLLEENAPLSGLGLCQIGELNFDLIKEQFKLSDNHILVHSLLGGKVEKLQ